MGLRPADRGADGRRGGGAGHPDRRGRGAGQHPETAAGAGRDESWPPNVALARRRLAPLGGTVAEDADDADLPFGDEAFDLVVSRHPVVTVWPEVARVLRPGGSYLSQQIARGPTASYRVHDGTAAGSAGAQHAVGKERPRRRAWS